MKHIQKPCVRSLQVFRVSEIIPPRKFILKNTISGNGTNHEGNKRAEIQRRRCVAILDRLVWEGFPEEAALVRS